VWIKIDETLPWIELKGEYQKRSEAKKAAKGYIKIIKAKIVEIPEKRTPMKPLASIKTAR